MSCRIKPQSERKRSRGSIGKSLGQRLYEWRRKKNFSQSEAALELKMSKRTVQEWEQGRAQPRHLALDALVRIIGR